MKIFPQLNCFTYVSKMKGRFDMKKMISAVISLMLILSSGASYSTADKYDYTVNGRLKVIDMTRENILNGRTDTNHQ